jgi:DNA adenine methylase
MHTPTLRDPTRAYRDERGLPLANIVPAYAEGHALPALKWAGGKRWLVPRLREIYAPFSARRLVEPFCGGLAVALGLVPDRALLNDVNAHLINFYRHLASGFSVPEHIAYENARERYDAARTHFNELIAKGEHDTPAAAALFYYLNRTGFNGLCRFNRRGQFNVPFGKYGTINYQRDFRGYRNVLGRWHFSHGDFAAITTQPGDFIYADPPYDCEFTAYSPGGFSWADQERLAEWLAAHDGPVVASNQATERIEKLYRSLGFTVELIEAPRRIACNGDRRGAMEVLALKGLSPTRRKRQ